MYGTEGCNRSALKASETEERSDINVTDCSAFWLSICFVVETSVGKLVVRLLMLSLMLLLQLSM
jgi:hypothetical protein